MQQAVEKRNEIIARLSFNLQEALARRDEVQLEAQSLAGQIKALQRQLQQVNAALNSIYWERVHVVSRCPLNIIVLSFLICSDEY